MGHGKQEKKTIKGCKERGRERQTERKNEDGILDLKKLVGAKMLGIKNKKIKNCHFSPGQHCHCFIELALMPICHMFASGLTKEGSRTFINYW